MLLAEGSVRAECMLIKSITDPLWCYLLLHMPELCFCDWMPLKSSTKTDTWKTLSVAQLPVCSSLQWTHATVIDKVLRVRKAQISQSFWLRCQRLHRPGPESDGTPPTAGTGRQAEGRGGHRPSASSASRTACSPQIAELRPVGRPSLGFYLRRTQKVRNSRFLFVFL